MNYVNCISFGHSIDGVGLSVGFGLVTWGGTLHRHTAVAAGDPSAGWYRSRAPPRSNTTHTFPCHDY